MLIKFAYYAALHPSGKPPLFRLCPLFFARLGRLIKSEISVSNIPENRLDRLEVLFSEQDYIIQTLNDLVARQNQEISELSIGLKQIKDQLQTLRTDLSGDITDPGNEKPPHY